MQPLRQLPHRLHGPRVAGGRQPAPVRRRCCGLMDRNGKTSGAVRPDQVPGLHRRAHRGLVLPEVPVLQEDGLARGRVPRGPAGRDSTWPTKSARRWRTRSSRSSRRLPATALCEPTLFMHYARLIEDIYAAERVRELLRGPGHHVHRHPRRRPGNSPVRASAWSRRRAAR